MTRTSCVTRRLASEPLRMLMVGALLASGWLPGADRDSVLAQDIPPGPGAPAVGPGTTQPGAPGYREATWPAPTAEDWARPCLIPWQRTWADALAVAKESGLPLLICVNMDGEIASEHYAGVVYRRPETLELFDRYVPVIASVYRHSTRDYDDGGRRIPCPRFGGVTCGEHIAIESLLYEKFFNGQRVAPRHIAVDLSGEELYDVFYAWTVTGVIDSIREAVADRPPPAPRTPGERTLADLAASPDSRDREKVEKAWAGADGAERRVLLTAAVARGPDAPVDLLRLALHDLDDEIRDLALRGLAGADGEGAVDLIVDTLRQPMAAEQHGALVDALARQGDRSTRARTLATAYRGLTDVSREVDIESWTGSLAAQAPANAKPPADAARQARLERQDEVLASGDADAHLDLAGDFLALSRSEPDPASARLLALDARQAAREAETLGASGPRMERALAVTAFRLGDVEEARQHAEAALPSLSDDPLGPDAAIVLGLFARSRQESIAAAVRAKRDWPSSWLADVHAAYSVLAHHPYGDPSQALMHHDFLRWFGAASEAARVLDEGLTRFPGSWELHDRLRARLLAEKGPIGLEAEYERRVAAPDAPAVLSGFAGYASLVAAEAWRRAHDGASAQAAYARAIRHYERFAVLDPESRAEADHYVAIAHAGEARIAFEAGQDVEALDQLAASVEREPRAAATLDGLNISAVETARLLGARLTAAGQAELLARYQSTLDQLDPDNFPPPAFEDTEGTPSGRGRRPRGGRPGGDRPEGAPPRDG